MSELQKLQQFFHGNGGDQQRFAAATAAAAFEVDGEGGEVSMISSSVFGTHSPQSTAPADLTPMQRQNLSAIKQSLNLPEGDKGREYDKYLQKLVHKLRGVTPAGGLRVGDITAALAAPPTLPPLPPAPLGRKPSVADSTGSIDNAVHYAASSYNPCGHNTSGASSFLQGPQEGGTTGGQHIMSQVEDEIEKDTQAAAQSHAIAKSLKDRAAFVRAKGALTGEEAGLRRLHSGAAEDFEKRLQEIGVQARKAGQAIALFDRDCAQCAVPPPPDALDPAEDYTAGQLEDDCGLTMSYKALCKHIEDMRCAKPLEAQQILSELFTASKARLGDKAQHALVAELASCGLSEGAGRLAVDFHSFLNSELFNTGVTVQRLEGLNRESEELSRTAVARHRAYQKEATDAAQEELGGALEALLQVAHKKVAMLSSVCGAPATDDIVAKREIAGRLVDEITAQCDSLDATLDDDAKRIVQAHDAMLAENEKAKSEARGAVQDCDARLAENAAALKSIAEQVSDLLRQFAEAGERRAQIVSRRAHVMEQGAAEQRRFEVRRKMLQEHVHLMQELKEGLSNTIRINHDVFLRGFVEQCSSQIRDKIKQTKSSLGDMRLQEAKSHLDAFTRYYLFNGDAIAKNEDRVKELVRLIRHHEGSAKHAGEVGDSQSQVYLQHARDLKQMKAACDERVSVLKSKLGGASQDFSCTEAALREAKVQFAHPAELFRDKMAQLKQRSLSHRRRLVEADSRDAEAEHVELQRLLDTSTGDTASRSTAN